MYHFLPLLLLCIFVSNFFTCPLLQQDYPSFLATLATPSAPSPIMPSLCWNHPSYSMTSVKVEFDKSDDCAYEEVEESSEDFGVSGGWPVANGQWSRMENCTGPSY
jgi:hypothetical protein